MGRGLILQIFAEVFTLYSALTFFPCSSRYQDMCPLGLRSREESKNYQNSKTIEKSGDSRRSIYMHLLGRKRGREIGEREELTSLRGTRMFPVQASRDLLPTLPHIETDSGPRGRQAGCLERLSAPSFAQKLQSRDHHVAWGHDPPGSHQAARGTTLATRGLRAWVRSPNPVCPDPLR